MKGTGEMTLTDRKFYLNFRKDPLGPMDERVPGTFLDQYGVLYHPNGIQYDHVEGSTGNIDLSTESATPHAGRAALAAAGGGK